MQYIGHIIFSVATRNYMLFIRNSNFTASPICFVFFLINLTTLGDGKQVNILNPR